MAGRRIEVCALGFDGACASAILRAECDAGGLLLVFAQAFRVPVHGRLFKVLERMWLPARLVFLIRAMYRPGMCGLFSRWVSVLVPCPTAGCPSAGPSSRWRSTLSSVCCLRTLATWLSQELPHLLPTLRRCARVSGLALKDSKLCVCVCCFHSGTARSWRCALTSMRRADWQARELRAQPGIWGCLWGRTS